MRLNPISAFFRLTSWKLDANQVKANPELREKCVKFGISSIIRSIVAFACTCGIFLFPMFKDNPVMFILVGILFGIGLPLAGAINYVSALIKSILQMSVNKKSIGWISLLILFILLAASAFIIFYVLTKM